MDEVAGISIRRYTDDDFAAVCALNGMGQNEPYAGAVFIRQAGALYRSTFLCAVCDGVVCGYTIGAPVTGGSAAAWIPVIFLSVHPENHPARSLYDSLGYMVTETICGYFGEGEDRMIMKKVLNTAKSSSLSPCR
ncbi:hypothetical protein [Methanogenium sp. MK-MG]|uniref:GNAT family N-acetyltransferase n=1 Tax=Methanogenium sp. MK-MG TaxID=2599926 RepID=UPI0013EA120B|nr:hypothetical protein [Methanogenium sp. MK-MG]KAF1076179.1 hypothetical protein MKMG_01551 [Methanogenium sp. MK-MG]